MIFTILFWLAVGALFHTYVAYPILLSILAKRKSENQTQYGNNEEWPSISILMAFHNESDVLEKKLINLNKINYPLSKVEILVGSDASDDGSDHIVQTWSHQYPHTTFQRFDQRVGKIHIINHLAGISRGEILVISDANVFCEPDCLHFMIRHFKNSMIGLVDSNMKHFGFQRDGISMQEHRYISREMKMKHHESLIWGAMMGPSGGFYAVRKELFQPVPRNFLVDDFYINLNVLSSGKKSIHEINAEVYEDISNSISEEFRRKVRIAAGNFQNLSKFAKFLLKPFSTIGFSFISHKVLRWLGPFLLLLAFVSNFFLIPDLFYQCTLAVQIVLLSIPIIDLILRKINIHIVILRFITHFYSMNLALLVGFGWFVKGIHSNVWEPTRRNQS